MKKTLICICLVAALTMTFGTANALVIEQGPNTYVQPEGFGTIASTNPWALEHRFYYYWSFDNLSANYTADDTVAMEIVFHNIYNNQIEDDDVLNLYIMDGRQDRELIRVEPNDAQDPDNPNWVGLGWGEIGSWTDADDYQTANDVIFQIGTEFLDILTGGLDGFTIGIDPDCLYFHDKITAHAPVPEPATMLLIGTGLIGLARFRKRKI